MEDLSFDGTIATIGNKFGKFDAICPLCSASRSTAEKRKRKVLRIWREAEDFLTYHCIHCGEKGWLRRGESSVINFERIEAARREAEARDLEARSRRTLRARYLWRASLPIQRTPAERYLREVRGISTCPLHSTLRFLPASRPGYHPALIAAYGLPREPEPARLEIGEDEVVAVQLTLLAENGLAKAVNEAGLSKISVGPCLGFPIAVSPSTPDRSTLAICEGIEDALSIYECTAMGAWASTGAKKLAALAPAVPQDIKTILIFADDDADGRAGAQALADALPGRECLIILPEDLRHE
jgi:hypothetical protein